MQMYILDTDHLSLIQRNGEDGKRILARVAALGITEIAVTVITYEEQVRGRLDLISRAKNLDAKVRAYAGLEQLATDYRAIAVLPFSETAASEHQRLRKAYPRLGNMDLRIAAIALTYPAILVTRNQSDFGQIIGLQTVEWSKK